MQKQGAMVVAVTLALGVSLGAWTQMRLEFRDLAAHNCDVHAALQDVWTQHIQACANEHAVMRAVMHHSLDRVEKDLQGAFASGDRTLFTTIVGRLEAIDTAYASLQHGVQTNVATLSKEVESVGSHSEVERRAQWMRLTAFEQRLGALQEELARVFALTNNETRHLALRTEHVEAALTPPDTNRMHRAMVHPTVRIESTREVGSGTVIASIPSKAGFATYILTAFHVISGEDGAITCTVRIYGVEETDSLDTEVLCGDASVDLALLRVKTTQQIPVARMLPRNAIERVRVFSRVYTVGCPLGYAPMPTPGEISTVSKELDGRIYWMMNAPTIFGNSGGGIFTADSYELIGVLSRVSAYNNFINIAVPHMGIFVPINAIYAWLDHEGYGALALSEETVVKVSAQRGGRILATER